MEKPKTDNVEGKKDYGLEQPKFDGVEEYQDSVTFKKQTKRQIWSKNYLNKKKNQTVYKEEKSR